MAYYQLSLDRKISKIWQKDKVCRKFKRKSSFPKPIESILAGILEKFRRVKTLENVYVKMKITKILDEVIGNNYFGTTENRKRFYYLVNKICTQSRYECVYISLLSKGYNFKVMSWLEHENLDEKGSQRVLQNTNLFLLRYVVKPLLKHFYQPLKCHKGYEIKFVERCKWHRFQHRVLNDLLCQKYLIPVNNQHLSRGVLKLYPKTTCDNLDYRPIVHPKRLNATAKFRFKRLSRIIEKLANTFSRIGFGSLYLSWKKYCEKTKGRTIYGAKFDVKDAFGNIDVEEMCRIIKRSNFSFNDKQFLVSHIQHQYIMFQKKLYRWNHGLLQGDSLSSSFCNLYMSSLEKEYLQEFNKPACFLHRIVDDYFFCSTEREDVDKFKDIIRSVHQLNEAKTQKTSDSNNELSYWGEIFNLETRQVSKHYDFKKSCPIRHKFKLWNAKKPIREASRQCIVSRALQFSYNNHCFKQLELNTVFNTEETVLRNFFEGLVFIAFKFDAAVMAISYFEEKLDDMSFIFNILEQVVSCYSNIVYFKMLKSKGRNFTGNITFMLLKNIAYRAFVVVLKKRNELYKNVICYINKKDLYLRLESLSVYPKIFNRLPKSFENVRINRKSSI